MNERNWKHEYEQTVSTEPPPAQARHDARADQRRHPRLQPAGVSVWIGVTPGVHLIDVTARHLEFYSDVALAEGQHLHLQFDGTQALQMEVLTCGLEETDPHLLVLRYRVRCRILSAKSA
ncbi:MAG TPA: hypothetical protein VGC20_15630 [bacterium]